MMPTLRTPSIIYADISIQRKPWFSIYSYWFQHGWTDKQATKQKLSCQKVQQSQQILNEMPIYFFIFSMFYRLKLEKCNFQRIYVWVFAEEEEELFLLFLRISMQ